MNVTTESHRLVLLPGLDGTGDLFGPFVDDLGPVVPPLVIRYPASRRLSLPEYVDHVRARLPNEPFTLLAESFSGLVGLTLLAEPPAHLHRMIFCATFVRAPSRLLHLPLSAPVGALLAPRLPDTLIRHFCLGRDAGTATLGLFRQAALSHTHAVLASRLHLIRRGAPLVGNPAAIPCDYLQPTGDRLVPDSAAADVARQTGNLQLHRLKGPHFLLQAHPAASAARVRSLLPAGSTKPPSPSERRPCN